MQIDAHGCLFKSSWRGLLWVRGFGVEVVSALKPFIHWKTITSIKALQPTRPQSGSALELGVGDAKLNKLSIKRETYEYIQDKR